MKQIESTHFRMTRLACAMLTAWGGAAQANSFVLQDLGVLGGTASYASGINAGGQVVGYVTTSVGYDNAFVTSANGGAMTDLGTLDGTWSRALKINDGGQVVGFTAGSSTSHAFITGLNGGPMTDLGTLGGFSSYAADINNNGQTVGYSSIVGDTFSHAFITAANGGAMRDLGTLGGNSSWAMGINTSGEVVGASWTTGDSLSHAFITGANGGAMRDLGTLGGANSIAYGINASGQVVGASNSAAGYNHAFITDPNGGAMRDLDTLGGTQSEAYGVNASGEVVGYSNIAGDAAWHPFLYTGTSLVDLSVLSGTQSSFLVYQGISINHFAQIAFTGLVGGEPRAYFLTLNPTWSAASGSWDNANNWDFGGAGALQGLTPGAPHNVVIDPTAAATITGPATNTQVSNLTVGGTGAPVTFNQAGNAALAVSESFVVNHDPGGAANEQAAKYVLGGAGSLNAYQEYIGLTGTGSFTQQGSSTNTATNLFVGNSYNASTPPHGTYTLQDNASLDVTSEYLGFAGVGDFVQSGGTHTVAGTLTLGEFGTGVGHYSLSGGALSANSEVIGETSGTGSFVQTGGTNTVAGTVTLSRDAGGSGSYTLAGGTLTTAGIVPGNGSATFYWEGGTLEYSQADFAFSAPWDSLFGYLVQISSNQMLIAPNVYVTQSAGITQWGDVTTTQSFNDYGNYALASGALTAHDETIGDWAYPGSWLIQDGGTNTVTGQLSVKAGSEVSRNGGYALSSGALVAASEVIGGGLSAYSSGNFTQYGGTNTVAGTLALGRAADSADGSYVLELGELAARNEIVGSSSFAADFQQFGGTNRVTEQLSIGAKGTYRLSGGSLEVGTLIDNQGTFIITTGAPATLAANIANNGELRVDSTVTFTGLVKGAGRFTGAGKSIYDGGFHVGNSPAQVTLENATAFGSTNVLDMDLAGTSGAGSCATCYAQLVFDGDVVFNGTLKLNLLSGFAPHAGDGFTLFVYNSTHEGTFGAFDLPTLAAGLAWNTSNLYNLGTLSVTTAPVPLPAPVWMLAGSLVLLGTTRRNRT